MKKLIKKILIVVLTLSFVIPTVIGCFWLTADISFKRSSLDMIYGETVDLSQYIEVKNDDSGFYTLSVTPTKILEISGTSVKAVGTGNVTVFATLSTGKSASMTVKANYAAISGIKLFESGKLYQDSVSAENVSFTAFLGDGTNSNTKLNWYVNSELKASSVSAKEPYTLNKKTEAGAYTVRAELEGNSDIFAEKTVRVYAPYDLPLLNYEGLKTYESLTSVSFSFEDMTDTDNPEYLFEMYINGELKQSLHSYSPTFDFTPQSAGIYKFEFKLNGAALSTQEEENSLTVCFKGVVTPYGLSLNFDDDYPSVYLKWANREETLFNITLKHGDFSTTINGADAAKGFLDIGSFIVITKSYTITITSATYGEIYLGGGSAVYTHNAVAGEAVEYLNKKYLASNYYMSCEDEVYEFFDFMLIFRPNANDRGEYLNSTCIVYIGYQNSHLAQYFSNRFRTRLTITGNYYIGVSLSGSKLSITIYFYSEDAPTNFSTSGKQPHEVFIQPVTSQTGYSGDLPVESFALSASEVSNTNQLYYTLQQGLYPLLVPGSMADTLFSKATADLKGITDNGMSEAEIVRAIFDYVMFKVSYDDNAAADSSIDNAVLQPAYYVEGVLTTGFAVCDGISKTFSLLSNMMGIKSVRVVGKATSGSNTGDHAWNKVLIEGQWYIVDGTWGIAKRIINSQAYKMGAHDYFLLSDSDVASSHTEMNIGYPKTAQVGYGWYIKNGLYFAHTDTDGVKAQVEALADKIEDNKGKKQYTVNGVNYFSHFATVEFQVAPTLVSMFKTDKSSMDFLTAALHRRSIDNFEYFISDTTIIVALR